MNRLTGAIAALALCLGAGACGDGKKAADAGGKMVVGFAQIGSESGWRAAETKMAKQVAEAKGVDLRISDAQQRQENQIKAIRGFIAQGVDAIFLAPVVATGWDSVLGEAKAAHIPVVLLDRSIETKDDSLYLSAVTSDTVYEGKVAGDWLVQHMAGKPCRVVEIQGTVGSSPATNRKKGFGDAIAAAPGITIVRSQSGDFTRAKAKEVMESFIKAEGAANICAVYAHNDDMMIGAIQAMKEAGMKPGSQVLTISIDAVPDIFKAMADGDANVTVELTPDMAGPAFDLLAAWRKDHKAPPKWVQTPSKLYTPETAAAEYAKRKDMY